MTAGNKCGAKTRSGGKCQRAPCKGRNRCRLHGGASHPGGPDHPAYRHGRLSKYQLPDRLSERVERALADPELLSLRQQIAVMDGRLAELLSQVNEMAPAETWGRLHAAMESFDNGDGEAIDTIRSLIESGNQDVLVWKGIESATEQLRKLIESERRAEIEADTMMSVTSVLSAMTRLMSMVYERIMRECPDQQVARTIVLGVRGDYARLCNHSTAATPDVADGEAG